jgi:hypothetical protein
MASHLDGAVLVEEALVVRPRVVRHVEVGPEVAIRQERALRIRIWKSEKKFVKFCGYFVEYYVINNKNIKRDRHVKNFKNFDLVPFCVCLCIARIQTRYLQFT